MNSQSGIFVVVAMLAMTAGGNSFAALDTRAAQAAEVEPNRQIQHVQRSTMLVADAGGELAESRRRLNETIDRSNDGFRTEAEAAAAKYEEAKTANGKWLHDHPKAPDDQKKQADRAVESLKISAIARYAKYIKQLDDTLDARLALGASAKQEMEKAKGTSDEQAANARYRDAKAAIDAVIQTGIAAKRAKEKIGGI